MYLCKVRDCKVNMCCKYVATFVCDSNVFFFHKTIYMNPINVVLSIREHPVCTQRLKLPFAILTFAILCMVPVVLAWNPEIGSLDHYARIGCSLTLILDSCRESKEGAGGRKERGPLDICPRLNLGISRWTSRTNHEGYARLLRRKFLGLVFSSVSRFWR